MKNRSLRSTALSATFVAMTAGWLLPSHAAMADAVTDFYKGRQMTMVIGELSGTGFDLYGRTLVRYMTRHMPGNPIFVVQNMLGASGINAANWIYSIAPKDGSTIGMIGPEAIFAPAFGITTAKYDSLKFTWLGNLDESVAVCLVTDRSGVKSFDDLKKTEIPFAGTGPNGSPSEFAYGLKNLLGAKIKIVQGYAGSAAMKLAMENGEVGGGCGVSVSTLKTAWKADIDSGRFVPIAEFGLHPHPELTSAAHIYDYAKTDEQKELFDVAFGRHALGRPVTAPPGIPEDRAQALRTAFDDTLKDPDFRADCAKQGLDLVSASGAEVVALLTRFFSMPKETLEKGEAAVRER
jgi:tripartite-type tricarboxylate transporter receptor subunit TctC